MSDMNEAAGDVSSEGVEQTTEQAIQEELFELIEGKNPDGTPIKKQYKKDEILGFAQKGRGADKAFEEAKATKKQMQDLARAMQDPRQLPVVLKHLGVDLDTWLQDQMAERLLDNMKSPEEKENERFRKEAEEWRKHQAKLKEDERNAAIEAKAAEIQTSLYSRIEETLNNAGVPKTQHTVAEIARYIDMLHKSAVRNNKPFDINTVKMEHIAAHLKKTHAESVQTYWGELDDDALLSVIPEKMLNRISAALTKKLSGGKVADINSIPRTKSPAAFTAEPAERPKTRDVRETNEIIESKIARAQAEWEKKFGR